MWKFTDWYDKNKQGLNAKRKSKYHSDAAYREAIIAKTAERRRLNKPEPRTGLTVAEACDHLDITTGTLSRWKALNYFPVSTLRGCRFTMSQVELLGLISAFFKAHPKRSSANHQETLTNIVSVIHHNWRA